MSEAPKLRVIDGNGEIDEGASVLPGDYALLVDLNAKHLRTIAALKGEITKLRRVDPQAETITEILDYWRTRTRHPKACIPLDGSRAKVTKARLADFTPDELKRAIDAAAERPWMGGFGERFCEAGPGRKRRDELELLFRDERHVEDLLALAEGDGPHRAYRRFVHDLCKRDKLVTACLAMLAEHEPHGEVLAAAAVWARSQSFPAETRTNGRSSDGRVL